MMKIIKWIAIILIAGMIAVLAFAIWRRGQIREAGDLLVADLKAGNIEAIYNKDVMSNYNTLDSFSQVLDLYGIKGAEFIEWTDYGTKNVHRYISGKFDLLEGGEEIFTFFFKKVDGDLAFVDIMKISLNEEDKE